MIWLYIEERISSISDCNRNKVPAVFVHSHSSAGVCQSTPQLILGSRSDSTQTPNAVIGRYSISSTTPNDYTVPRLLYKVQFSDHVTSFSRHNDAIIF